MLFNYKYIYNRVVGDQNAPASRLGSMNWIGFLAIVFLFSTGCKKLVQIGAPVSTITTTEAFADSSDANSAILGIYNSIAVTQANIYFGNGAITVYSGSSSDELFPFQGSASPSDQYQMYTNSIEAANMNTIYGLYWTSAYQVIYQTNACITDVLASKGISVNLKLQLEGEAKFIRALYYFYLVNLFGDVPYITSINYNQTSLAAKSPSSEIYQFIVSDLKAAQTSLRVDYSLSNGLRTRANQSAATALLARTYLYMGDWADAAAQATITINNANFSLVQDLNLVFSTNSTEAILQWQLNDQNFPFNATAEGINLIPYDSTSYPFYCISPQLMNAFDSGDLRKVAWIDSTDYMGTEYYYPYKYKVGPGQYSPNGPLTEFYTVLRLGEQYLIRAESEANGAVGGLTAAIADLNVIRQRAGLPILSPNLNKEQVISAVAKERRVELFAEWAHRWLDLKRTGAIDSVMSISTVQKGGANAKWNSFQQLYPIPQPELLLDPNLTQNNGY